MDKLAILIHQISLNLMGKWATRNPLPKRDSWRMMRIKKWKKPSTEIVLGFFFYLFNEYFKK